MGFAALAAFPVAENSFGGYAKIFKTGEMFIKMAKVYLLLLLSVGVT